MRCKAIQHSDQKVCMPCNLTWDMNDKFPPECKSECFNAVGSPLATQQGGTHYKDLKIQPIEYIHANKLGYIEGNVVKYITRHKEKNGAEDIKKIIHYCELLLELEYK